MKNSEIINVPAVALRGLTVLPGMIIHFDVSREKSKTAVNQAMSGDEKIFLVTQKDPNESEPDMDGLYSYGTLCLIKQVIKTPSSMVRVMVEGLFRCELLNIEDEKTYIQAGVVRDDPDETDGILAAGEAMTRILKDGLKEYVRYYPKFSRENMTSILNDEKLSSVIFKLSADIEWNYIIRQALLESPNLTAKYEILMAEITKEIQVLKIKADFQAQLKDSIDKNQREYILREQMKLIQKELGDGSPLSDAEEFEKKLKTLKAGKEVKDKINKEIQRLKNMPGGGQESNVIRTYLDTVFEIPWEKISRENKDIAKAAEILNEDHYGLEKVKERVIEYLAVRMLSKENKGPILCLVGPPGTGKTSIARSVARALNKHYVRISLGGIKDEAEIRGHRKTYVGAMPGRIVEGLIYAGVSDPLMLLDEIDKVSSDYRGDTSSALLEVLDSEQNVRFRDHFVELPIDLSRVLFIATANSTETIPRPLLDRMEIIEVNSYTENEKFHIAKSFLLEKQMKANGIKKGQVSISDDAIKMIIHNYTREAGVRNLERRIGDIERKCARSILEGKKAKISITDKNLVDYLGQKKVNYEEGTQTEEVGIVTGLAWTSVGGDTLQIEVGIMPGKGELSLTGQMGDVMKESAKAGLTCIRTLSSEYGIKADFYEKHDIHIHIPEGAVPKDGPSAGITMATAMLSAVTGMSVKKSIAMTGEITIRGRVLPIGGLKEKLLAAKTAHITEVIVPLKNKTDVEELSKEITDGLNIIYVSSFEEVIKEALNGHKKRRTGNSVRNHK